MLKSTNTARGSCDNVSKTGTLTMPRYSETYGSSTEHTPENIKEYVISLRLAFPANPSVSQENDREPTTKEICGLPPSSAYARLDPNTHCWKTSQVSLLLDTSELSFETFPKAGMILDGGAYRRLKWEQTIREIGSGLWPSPDASQRGNRTRESFERRTREGHPPDLEDAAKMWPTPQTQGLKECVNGKTRPLKMYPTPGVHETSGGATNPAIRKVQGHHVKLKDKIGGQLNPTWVDWLMGFPIGWTDLEPLETHKFQSWLKQFGSC